MSLVGECRYALKKFHLSYLRHISDEHLMFADEHLTFEKCSQVLTELGVGLWVVSHLNFKI